MNDFLMADDVEGDVPADSWLATLVPGMSVYWTDPDQGACSGTYQVSEILEESGRVCWHDSIVRLTNEEGSFVEAYASELSQEKPAEQLTICYQVTVTYDANGTPRESLFENLREIFNRARDEGLLTGSLPAELASFSERIVVVPPTLDESELEELMLQRIESGGLPLEEIPSRLVSYGLMDPADFATEMTACLGNRG